MPNPTLAGGAPVGGVVPHLCHLYNFFFRVSREYTQVTSVNTLVTLPQSLNHQFCLGLQTEATFSF